MVYGAALERRFVGNCIEGSNPSPSAMLKESPKGGSFNMVRDGMRTPVPVALAGPEAIDMLGAYLWSTRSGEANPS